MWKNSHRSSKFLDRSPRCHKNPILLLPLLIIGLILLILKNSVDSGDHSDTPKVKFSKFQSSVEFSHSREIVKGTELIWQIPEMPKAVLFIAHGCNCRGGNFWDRSTDCPNCVGLPEDRIIVLSALERKFAVITVSSSGRCWSLREEVNVVKSVIENWIEKNRLGKLPVMALGASSGGYFVSVLAKKMRFSSIVIMIAEGAFDSIPNGYPPTLFVHMPKDVHRKKLIKINMEALRKKGVRVKEIRCVEFPLTPTLFSDRIAGVDESFSVKLFEFFREKRFIDDKGYLKNDGRVTSWKEALREQEPGMEKYEWLDHIQEELNLAFSYHEMTSLQISEILDWLEDNMT